MNISPHVENSRRVADGALRRATRGGGLKGWAIRRVIAWFRRRLKKPESVEDIARICEVIIAILTYLRSASWMKQKNNKTLDLALKAFQELRASTVGG